MLWNAVILRLFVCIFQYKNAWQIMTNESNDNGIRYIYITNRDKKNHVVSRFFPIHRWLSVQIDNMFGMVRFSNVPHTYHMSIDTNFPQIFVLNAYHCVYKRQCLQNANQIQKKLKSHSGTFKITHHSIFSLFLFFDW